MNEQEIIQTGIFATGNTVLASLLVMCGEELIGLANQYDESRLAKFNTTATRERDGHRPGNVVYGFKTTDRLREICNAFDLQKEHIKIKRNIEVEASEMDCARIVATFASIQKEMSKAWQNVTPTIRSMGDKSFKVVSVNAAPETLEHLQ